MARVKEIIKELLQGMGINNVKLEIKKDSSLKDRELLIVSIEMDPEEARYFIREGAAGLSAFQHLIRILVSKEAPEQAFLMIDINEYRIQREKFLTDMALKAVQKVRKIKKPILLDPMPAYERRLIHLKLAEEPDVVTESTGQEPERRVVIRLYP
jgi:spoIIIJ-associated protein